MCAHPRKDEEWNNFAELRHDIIWRSKKYMKETSQSEVFNVQNAKWFVKHMSTVIIEENELQHDYALSLLSSP